MVLTTTVNSMLTAISEDGMTDVVKSASWTRTATEVVGEGEEAQTYTASFPGVTPFSAPDPASFTPYEDITEEQVIGWIDSKVDMPAIDARLIADVQNQITPNIVVLPLPWAQPTNS
jgi:hypothetical protein